MPNAEWDNIDRTLFLPEGNHGMEPGMVIQCDGKRYWILKVEGENNVEVVPEFRLEKSAAQPETFPWGKVLFLLFCLWVIWKVIF